MTVKHIIGECSLFNVTRRRKFKNANNFEAIMDKGSGFYPERIFEFLK